MGECSNPWITSKFQTDQKRFARRPENVKGENVFSSCFSTVKSLSDNASKLTKLSREDQLLLDNLFRRAFIQTAANQDQYLDRFAKVSSRYRESTDPQRDLLSRESNAAKKPGSDAKKAGAQAEKGIVRSVWKLEEVFGAIGEYSAISADYAKMVRDLCVGLLNEFVRTPTTG
jgi:hypothetical protein